MNEVAGGRGAPLIEARNLTIRIGANLICNNLNLRISATHAWAFLGPNGAGKSTLLHTLAGLRMPDSGQVTVRQSPLHSWSAKQRAKELGLLFQHPDTGFPARVLDAVLAGRHPHLGRWGWETGHDLAIARGALAAVGLADLEQRFLDTLSGGERRRVEIATLLAQEPRCALLDEPGNHLDMGYQIKLLELLTARFTQDDHALVTVVHDPTLAVRFCDHALFLHGNGAWQTGPIGELASAERLTELYGYPVIRLDGPSGPVYSPV